MQLGCTNHFEGCESSLPGVYIVE
jgi:hypothetical protein